MEKFKIITIKEEIFDKIEHKFKVRLFNAIEGLRFFEKIRETAFKENIDIYSENNSNLKLIIQREVILKELFKLVCMLDINGINITKEIFTIEDAGLIFNNYQSIIDLGFEIFNFQSVFWKNSEQSQV